MTTIRFEKVECDPIHEAAADWFARLQDLNLSLEDALAWQTWIAADDRHGEAFRRIEDTWQRFRGMQRPPLESPGILAADDYDGSRSVSRWKAFVGHRSNRPKWALAATLAAVAIGAGIVLHLHPYASSDNIAGAYETRVGENRGLLLADGSSVILGGGSRLETAFSGRWRRLSLVRGEAFFTVAKDASRPFSVRAGSTLLTALGTAFNVRRADDRVTVTVVEGRVLVEPPVPIIERLPLSHATLPAKLRPNRLAAGDRTIVDTLGIESASHMNDRSIATSWQTGRLAYDEEPLHYVLKDVNRYASKPIVAGNEKIAALDITGTVLSDNIGGWLASLVSAFGLRVVEEPTRFVLVDDGSGP